MSSFPHTHYTENSTTFDLTFQNFPYKHTSSRIVLEMYVVPGPAFQARGDIQSNRNIDDEYTPSVFETYTYLFGSSYIQWKPISYQDGSRASTASQQANYLTYQGLLPSDRGQLPQGLASAVFGPDANVTRFYMVIGTSGDNTYLSSEYFTWLDDECCVATAIFFLTLSGLLWLAMVLHLQSTFLQWPLSFFVWGLGSPWQLLFWGPSM